MTSTYQVIDLAPYGADPEDKRFALKDGQQLYLSTRDPDRDQYQLYSGYTLRVTGAKVMVAAGVVHVQVQVVAEGTQKVRYQYVPPWAIPILSEHVGLEFDNETRELFKALRSVLDPYGDGDARSTEQLEECVHDIKAEEASNICNQGRAAVLDFLRRNE